VINKGLAVGELVVTDGQYQLRPGARVAQKSLDSPRGPKTAPSPSGVAGPPGASSGGKPGAPR